MYKSALCLVLLVCELGCLAQHLDGSPCVDYKCSALRNGVCLDGICRCKPHFYDRGDFQCVQRINSNGICNDSIPSPYQCLDDNAECQSVKAGSQTQHKCICRQATHYANNDICEPRIAPGFECNPTNDDPLQCVDKAECSNSTNTCACEHDSFNDGDKCAPRISVNVTCKPDLTDLKQCMDHAHCDQRSASCVCDVGYYKAATPHCNQSIPLNVTCDLSINDTAQCENPRASCLQPSNHSHPACVCGDDFYLSQDGSDCLIRRAPGLHCERTIGTNDINRQCVDEAYCGTLDGRLVCVCKDGFIYRSGSCVPTSSASTSAPGWMNDQQSDSPGNEIKYYSIIAVLSGLILVLLLIFLVYVLRRQLRRKQDKHPQSSDLKNVCPTNSGVAIIQFGEHLDTHQEHPAKPLALQFQILQKLQNSGAFGSTTVGSLPRNKPLSRCFSVLPYDHTRVQLLDVTDGNSDYINASLIEGLSSPDEYIATQAPLESTITDFWKMVFQQRSGIIVMLADLVEDGRSKVVQYWPDETIPELVCGEVTVTLTSCQKQNNIIIRTMIASMVLHDALSVTQFHLPGWWKDGVSLDPQELLNFIRSVRQVAPSSEGPITVHCSTGTGRTGMYIALDILTRFVEQHDLNATVDVFSTVQTIMSCRPDIIQSEDQYMFIHEVLRVAINNKLKLYQLTNGPSVNKRSIRAPDIHRHDGRAGTTNSNLKSPRMSNGLDLSRTGDRSITNHSDDVSDLKRVSYTSTANPFSLRPMSRESPVYHTINGHDDYVIYTGQEAHWPMGKGIPTRIHYGYPNPGYEDYRMSGRNGISYDV